MIDMNFVPLSGPKGDFYKIGVFFKNGEDRKRYFDNIYKKIPDSWNNVVYYTNSVYFTETCSGIDINIFLFVVGNYVKGYNLDLIVYDIDIQDQEAVRSFQDFCKETPQGIDMQQMIEETGEKDG